MQRVLAVGSLLAVFLLVTVILLRGGHRPLPRSAPVPAALSAPAATTPTETAPGSADGGGYFNPNCPKPLHWTMSVARCMPPWKPGEP